MASCHVGVNVTSPVHLNDEEMTAVMQAAGPISLEVDPDLGTGG
jgi:hypothetical protein